VKKTLLLISVFAFAASAVSQGIKHAPTLESCSADLNLWTSQIPGFPTSTAEQDQAGTKALTVAETTSRLSHLDECSRAYTALNKNRIGELSELFSLELIYVQEIQIRRLHFLSRHGLTAKFYEEDETGKR
jgi:hypothetical protein